MEKQGFKNLISAIKLMHDAQEQSEKLKAVEVERGKAVRRFIESLLETDSDLFEKVEKDRQFVMKYQNKAYVVTVKSMDNISIYEVDKFIDGDSLLLKQEYEEMSADKIEEATEFGIEVWGNHIPRIIKNYGVILDAHLSTLKESPEHSLDIDKEFAMAKRITAFFENTHKHKTPVIKS